MDKDDGTTSILKIATSVRPWRTENKVLGFFGGFLLTQSNTDAQPLRKQPGTTWPVTLPLITYAP